MTLLAHHLELQHLPVLTIFLGVGIWMGWHAVSGALKRRESTKGIPGEPDRDPLKD